MNHFSIRLWHVMKSGFYITNATTNSVAGWRRSSKPLSKAKLAPKKIMVTVWWSSVGLIHCSFLNPGKTITSEKYALQINEIHWKVQYLQPAFVNRMGPILFHNNAQLLVPQPILQKLNKLSYKVLPRPPYSFDLSTDYHLFKQLNNFLQGKLFHNQQEAEFFKSSLNPKA